MFVRTPQNELGRVAPTFNDLLPCLDGAYRAQQRFASDVAHELRAPPTAIQAHLELLVCRPDIPAPDHQAAMEEASRAAPRLARLVADLLVPARAAAVTLRLPSYSASS